MIKPFSRLVCMTRDDERNNSEVMLTCMRLNRHLMTPTLQIPKVERTEGGKWCDCIRELTSRLE